MSDTVEPTPPSPWRVLRFQPGDEPALFVVHGGDGIVGYADLQADGLIDHFFVSGHHPGCGIGAVLMQRIHEEADLRGLVELHAHVSLSAEAFFRRSGFEVVERRMPVRRGIALPNALMRKRLSPGEGLPAGRT